MIPQRQLIKHDPANGRFGDCHRTCIAAILDLHPLEVPHFCDGTDVPDKAHPDHWLQRQDRFLTSLGLAASWVAYAGDGVPIESVLHWTSGQSPGVPMILTGRSALGINHSVVVMDSKIVCDPSGNGIVGPTIDGTWEIMTLSVGRAWEARGISRRDGAIEFQSGFMSPDEQQRWLTGRHDWRADDWQDHCGDTGCEQCAGTIP